VQEFLGDIERLTVCGGPLAMRREERAVLYEMKLMPWADAYWDKNLVCLPDKLQYNPDCLIPHSSHL